MLTLSLVGAAALAAAGCTGFGPSGSGERDVPSDVQAAIDALPRVDQVILGQHGLPTFVTGDLGAGAQERALEDAALELAPALEAIAPVFRLEAKNLTPRQVQHDQLGMMHVRYAEVQRGLPVIGAETIVHVAADGTITSVSSSSHGATTLPNAPAIAAEDARQRALAATPAAARIAAAPELVYLISTRDDQMHLAWQTRVSAPDLDSPLEDLVYVDALTGEIADRHGLVHTARNRRVYDSGGSSSLPGTLRIQEGGASVTDAVIMAAYDNTGTTYDCYAALFNRDSYNDGGAQLRSTVHYGNKYNNAFWNGSQMVYGDGDGVQMTSLALALDVTAHELTHGVIQHTANLVYSNEPGAINEGMADILSARCEAWANGGIDANTWKLGEDAWTPNQPGDAMRYMNNPTADGISRDYYPERYTGSQDYGGVHLNSGIANLAFVLLSQGGTHPRGKTSVQVPGIGIDKAGHIFYRALAVYLTSSSNFATARNATMQAAQDLYGAAEKNAVQAAWAAVGVGQPPAEPTPDPTPEPTPTPEPGIGVLENGVPVDGLGGAKGAEAVWKLDVPAGASNLTVALSGGTGDADLYVRYGQAPTLGAWDYRPYENGNNETVNATHATEGSWYVMLHGYSAYAGVKLVASYTLGGGNEPQPDPHPALQNDVQVNGLGAGKGQSILYRFEVPEGATSLGFAIGNGTGDADLYVRHGAVPTLQDWDYRPYKWGNSEQVSATPKAGTWYVMIHAYETFANLSAVARYQ